jgi:hypothetical protein
VLEAPKAGANNYMVKPFTGKSLAKKVEQTMAWWESPVYNTGRTSRLRGANTLAHSRVAGRDARALPGQTKVDLAFGSNGTDAG